MSLEELLKERDSLREEIEEIRKQNEGVLLSIQEFFIIIDDYVSLCKLHGLEVNTVVNLGNEKYLIKCDQSTFYIHKSCRELNCYYVFYENGEITKSKVGINPTLERITKKDGSLIEEAIWFRDNIKTIISIVDSELENCVKMQIEEAKQILGK